MEYDVSRETARKWLVGLALPELRRMVNIALRSRVSFEWLATGRGSPGSLTSISDAQGQYGDAEQARLLGLVRRLPRKKRQALITLLEG